MAYSDQFVRGLEWLYGRGFLSPGGPQEIQRILEGCQIQGKKVLDVGCGIGGIDRLLLSQFGAQKVVGIDVEPWLLERAKDDAQKAGLTTKQIQYKLVEPGPFQFDDSAFDVVFTKDAIIHVKAKCSIYEEIFRVLKSNGFLVGSDWLGSANANKSKLVKDWLDYSKLDFHFWTSSQMKTSLQEIGFAAIAMTDRNHWYRQVVRDEISKVTGESGARYIDLVGAKAAEKRLRSSTLKMKVVNASELRPTIFRAHKP